MESSILTTVLLPLALAFIMLGMGLSLTLEDFKRVFIQPRAIFTGLFSQLILLPILGFFLIWIFDLDGSLAIGFMILAACPGGATSNLISHLSNADTALSISLTAISGIITIFSIPLIVNFALSYFNQGNTEIQLPFLKTVAQVFVITLLPVFIGMLIRQKNIVFAQKSEKPIRLLSAIFLALIILAALLKERENLIDFFIDAGPAAFALNIGSMLIGLTLAGLLSINVKQSLSIAIESGIQNGTLGITIAATLLNSSAMTIPSAIYSLIMFFSAFMIIMLSNKWLKTEKVVVAK